jgi:hypothetical protein
MMVSVDAPPLCLVLMNNMLVIDHTAGCHNTTLIDCLTSADGPTSDKDIASVLSINLAFMSNSRTVPMDSRRPIVKETVRHEAWTATFFSTMNWFNFTITEDST